MSQNKRLFFPDDASSILGVWEGPVSSIGEGWSETTTKGFVIKNDCNSEGICLSVPWLENNGKTFDQFEILEETELEAPLYCFGEYQEIVQMSLIYWFCFHPIDQSTLQYEGGGGLWYEEGVLTRLNSASNKTPTGSEIAFLAEMSEGYAINTIDLEPNVVSTIVASPSRISEFAWSYDGVKIAYAVESLTGESMSVDMLDVTTHSLETIIWPHKISAGQFARYLTYTQPRWSPDDDFLYFRPDDGRASGSSLRRISLSSGRQIVISPPSASFDFDVSAIHGFIVWREWFNGYDVLPLPNFLRGTNSHTLS